jgi:hypothetical protein
MGLLVDRSTCFSLLFGCVHALVCAACISINPPTVYDILRRNERLKNRILAANLPLIGDNFQASGKDGEHSETPSTCCNFLGSDELRVGSGATES